MHSLTMNFGNYCGRSQIKTTCLLKLPKTNANLLALLYKAKKETWKTPSRYPTVATSLSCFKRKVKRSFWIAATRSTRCRTQKCFQREKMSCSVKRMPDLRRCQQAHIWRLNRRWRIRIGSRRTSSVNIGTVTRPLPKAPASSCTTGGTSMCDPSPVNSAWPPSPSRAPSLGTTVQCTMSSRRYLLPKRMFTTGRIKKAKLIQHD